jgi:hypothetical protein
MIKHNVNYNLVVVLLITIGSYLIPVLTHRLIIWFTIYNPILFHSIILILTFRMTTTYLLISTVFKFQWMMGRSVQATTNNMEYIWIAVIFQFKQQIWVFMDEQLLLINGFKFVVGTRLNTLVLILLSLSLLQRATVTMDYHLHIIGW